MILFGELSDGGMVEVRLSKDAVPKLEVKFKSKIQEKVKVDEKAS